MNRIKFIAAVIFGLSVILAFYSKSISMHNDTNLKLLNTINQQKAFAQEISKNVFYIYRNKEASAQQLDESIEYFMQNMNHREDILSGVQDKNILNQVDVIVSIWKRFHTLVAKFKELNKLHNGYTAITLEVLVRDIYDTNLKLVKEFDKLLDMHKIFFENLQNDSKNIQLVLFIALIILLLYLFSQLKELMLFIQKFLQTSKNIIHKSTVKGLKKIDDEPTLQDVSIALNDFNFLVEKIVSSIDDSTYSIENSAKSLESVEKNIEHLLDLIAEMESDNDLDKELIKKEDTLIEALDELSSSIQKLKTIKTNLINFKQ